MLHTNERNHGFCNKRADHLSNAGRPRTYPAPEAEEVAWADQAAHSNSWYAYTC